MMGGKFVPNPNYPNSSGGPWMWVHDEVIDWGKVHEEEESRYNEQELKRKKNCKETCRWAIFCKAEGDTDTDPYECGLAAVFEDRWMDAEDIRREQERSMDDEDDIPFCDEDFDEDFDEEEY